jgi:hypothetical protein
VNPFEESFITKMLTMNCSDVHQILKPYGMRIAAILTLIGSVTGCSTFDDQLRPEFSVSYSKDDIYNIPSSLDATATQFFSAAPSGRVIRAGQSASASGGFVVDIDKDTLSADSDTVYAEQASSKLQLRAGVERALGDHAALVGGVSLSRGASRYFLPDGAGVLVDPITINFDTTGIEVDAGLAVFTGRRIESRFDIGIGGSLTDTRTRITSALLNVTNKSTYSAGFIYTGVQLAVRPANPGQPKLQLNARVKYYPDAGVSVRSAIALAF